jgi:hypothetical protein
MDSTEATTGHPPTIEADAQAVIEQVMSGKPVDPDAARRVHARAQQIRREILEKHGVLNVAVDLIRETRDEA